MRHSEFPIMDEVGHLRRHFKILFVLNVCLIASIAGAWLLGAKHGTAQDCVIAKRMLIVDDNGEVRVEIETRDGLPQLTMYDSHNTKRYYSGLDSRPFKDTWYDHVQSVYYTETGEENIVVGMGVVSIFGDECATQIFHGGATFEGAGGSQKLSLQACYFDGPAIQMVGSEANIKLLESRGKTMAILGAATLELQRTGSQEHLTPGSLVLFDRNGAVLSRLP